MSGATSTAELLVEFPPLGDDDSPLDRLAVVRAAHIAAIKSEPVDGAISAISFLPTLSKKKSISASSKRAAVARMIRDEESGLGRLGMISRDEASEVWRITLRLTEPEGVDYSVTLAEIETAVEEALQESEIESQLLLTGPAVVTHAAQVVLLRDLFRSFLTAFAVVGVVMIVVLRSLRGGLVAMIPKLIPDGDSVWFHGTASDAARHRFGDVSQRCVGHRCRRYGAPAFAFWFSASSRVWPNSSSTRGFVAVWLGDATDNDGVWPIANGLLVQ